MASGDITRLGGYKNYDKTIAQGILPANAFSANTYVTLVDITGEGMLYYAFVGMMNSNNLVTIKIILDGVTLFEGACMSNGNVGFNAGIIPLSQLVYYSTDGIRLFALGSDSFITYNAYGYKTKALPFITSGGITAGYGEVAGLSQPIQFKTRLQVQVKAGTAIAGGGNQINLLTGIQYK
jgi:hypothetical protein